MKQEESMVLVLDDDPEARIEIVSLMESLGYPVVSSGRGERIADIVSRTHPSIVVSSIRRPCERGEELADVIKKTSPATQVILMSSGGEWDAFQRIVDEGGPDRLPRPWRKQDLRHGSHTPADASARPRRDAKYGPTSP